MRITTVICDLKRIRHTTNVVVDLLQLDSCYQYRRLYFECIEALLFQVEAYLEHFFDCYSDTLKEGLETIDFNLLSFNGAEVGATSAVSITIEDDMLGAKLLD